MLHCEPVWLVGIILKRIHKESEPLAFQYFSTWKMFYTKLPAETEIKKKINLFFNVFDVFDGRFNIIH